MLEEWIRNPYQRLLVDPVVKVISPKITPIKLTMTAALLGTLFIPAAIMGFSFSAILLLLLSGYCDTIDGSLARYRNDSSDLGAVLDIMSDRWVEACVIVGLYCTDPGARALPCLFMLASILLCVTSFLVVGIFTENDSHKGFHYSCGLVERAEAFIFFIAMIVLPSFFNEFALIFSGLVLLTAIIRLAQFVKAQGILAS